MHHRNFLFRKLQTLVQRHNGGVIPLCDFAEVNVRKYLAGHLKLPGLDPRQIEYRNIPAYHDRKLREPRRFQLLGLQWHIRGAKIDRLLLDLRDAAARTYRLIVDLQIRLLLVGL